MCDVDVDETNTSVYEDRGSDQLRIKLLRKVKSTD